MTTSSRRMSQKLKAHKASHTAGKEKGGNCVKSELKTWGAKANPYKLKGGDIKKFEAYSDTVRSLNK